MIPSEFVAIFFVLFLSKQSKGGNKKDSPFLWNRKCPMRCASIRIGEWFILFNDRNLVSSQPLASVCFSLVTE